MIQLRLKSYNLFWNARVMNEGEVDQLLPSTGTQMSPVISRVTGLKLTKFLHTGMWLNQRRF